MQNLESSHSGQIQVHESPQINWTFIFVLSFYKEEPEARKQENNFRLIVDGGMEGCREGWMEGCREGWLDGWRQGCREGWMEG